MIARDLLSRVASVLLSVGRFRCIETKYVREGLIVICVSTSINVNRISWNVEGW
jgi:Zn finger protein HypA/HybF involved in hydrogenase expression